MSRVLKISAIALLALLTMAPVASARGFGAGRPYHFQGFFGYGYYPGLYGPGWWYDPWYGSWWGPGYVPGPRTGQVKIITKHKGEAIYVDGGYAGRTGELKKFPLRAGTHTIELRDSRGRTRYQERIHVIAGKTIKIHADYFG
ncbi:MAG: PEGA domain-containing protein [Acidobacteriia bacterium]|nr:PEGA domain-containing protein [Terriglobia bacterium]